MQNDQRTQRMQMMNQAQYQSMMRGIPNGVDPNNLKRAALSRNPYVLPRKGPGSCSPLTETASAPWAT
jgi:hypothetical protein